MTLRDLLALALLALVAACAGVPTDTVAPRPAATVNDSAKWEADIVAFEQADSVVRRKPGGIVFVGSSSIRMWETLADDFPDAAIINRGFGGSRVRDATYYADRIVTNYRPRAVALYSGDNDLAEGRTPRQVRDDFVAFAERIHASLPQARVGYIAIKPSPSRAALQPRMAEANALIAAYADSEPRVDYLDVHTPMLGADGRPRPGLFLDDDLHMSRAGYGVWVDVVGPWLRALPDPTPPSR